MKGPSLQNAELCTPFLREHLDIEITGECSDKTWSFSYKCDWETYVLLLGLRMFQWVSFKTFPNVGIV